MRWPHFGENRLLESSQSHASYMRDKKTSFAGVVQTTILPPLGRSRRNLLNAVVPTMHVYQIRSGSGGLCRIYSRKTAVLGTPNPSQ